ncbi:hypothetical protein GCM10011505_37670 [Tistrella bauzanensis]|uniref:Uncharacterized protein n=1 Tax=Tistrella bauzanensis TaxID=657419 RepID=A0ABQ1IWQ3_9PROT|nr:hypothetical protein [Tistrella bauzanensis]GGB53117.1 hypothetical protein GCM10011505_37670 [Tistrella bauzanensis]
MSADRDARWRQAAALTVLDLASGDHLLGERRARRMLKLAARQGKRAAGPRRSAALAGLSVLLWRPPHLVVLDAMAWLDLIAPFQNDIAGDRRLDEAMTLAGVALTMAAGSGAAATRRWAGIAGPDMCARVRAMTTEPPASRAAAPDAGGPAPTTGAALDPLPVAASVQPRIPFSLSPASASCRFGPGRTWRSRTTR